MDARKFGFPKSRRIRRNGEYQYVYRRGRAVSCERMTLFAAKSRYGARAGFSVGKKIGNSVARSRAKRLLKESYRLQIGGVKSGQMLVFVARPPIKGAKLMQVYKDMAELLKRAGCLKAKMDDEKSADGPYKGV